MRNSHVALCLFLLIAFETGADAQISAVRLTLDDAVSRALEVSHRLGEIRAREQAAQATVRVRRAEDQPTVTASAGYARTNHVQEFGVPGAGGAIRLIYPDIPDNYFTRLLFQWPIYTSGRTDALERAAEAEARAIGAELQAARADLRLEVVRAFWAVQTATDSVRVLDQALSRAEAHLRDVRSRFDAGLVPPNEVSSVEAQRSRQQMHLIEARNLLRSVAEDLRRLTGMGPDAEIEVAHEGPNPGFASARSLQREEAAGLTVSGPEAAAGVSEALRQRSERQALLARLAAAQDRQRAAATGTRPMVAVTGAVDYANPNPRIFPRTDAWRESWDMSVNVSWPLWDGGRGKAAMAEAAAATTAVRERLADLDALIVSDVRQRLLEVDSAGATLGAAGDAVRSAEEARRVVAERFAVGVATSTDVLDAQVALLQADLDRTRAAANLRLAEARLERALGR